MLSSIFAASLFAASVLAQGVKEGIAPSSPPPAGCETTYKGEFSLHVLDVGQAKAAAAGVGAVTCTLHDGILHDTLNRTGAIVANRQFQFDGPPQAGSIYTGGWSSCKNGSLALGGSTVFWACTSGEFRNLYDEKVAEQCTPINLIIVGNDAAASSSLLSSDIVSLTATINTKSPSKTPSAALSDITSYSSAFTTTNKAVTSNGTASITNTVSDLTASSTGVTVKGTDSLASKASSLSSAASSIASSATSTGGAVATAAARDFLGAAIGAFGAAIALL